MASRKDEEQNIISFAEEYIADVLNDEDYRTGVTFDKLSTLAKLDKVYTKISEVINIALNRMINSGYLIYYEFNGEKYFAKYYYMAPIFYGLYVVRHPNWYTSINDVIYNAIEFKPKSNREINTNCLDIINDLVKMRKKGMIQSNDLLEVRITPRVIKVSEDETQVHIYGLSLPQKLKDEIGR